MRTTKTNRSLSLLLCCVMVLCVLTPLTVHATQQQPKTVRVGWFEGSFNNVDSFGRRTGYAYDYQQKIAAYTGWEYEYVEAGWAELFGMLQRGEIDLLADVTYTPERAQKMLFSAESMGYEEYYILIRAENPEIDPEDFTTLNGKRVGVNKGSVQEQMIRRWLETNDVRAEIVLMDGSLKKYRKMMETGALDAIVNVSGFDAFEESLVPIVKIGVSDFYFAVSRDRVDLKQELDMAMSQILSHDSYYDRDLYEKYMSNSGVFRFLSSGESAWLESHGTIRIGYRDDYLPFSDRDDETGEVQGLLREFMNETAATMRNAAIPYEAVAYQTTEDAFNALKRGEVDCLFPVCMSPYDAETMQVLLTGNIVETEVFAAYKTNSSPACQMEDNTRVAVYSGNLDDETVIKDNFPRWRMIFCDTVDGCFQAVGDGRADCLLICNYQLNIRADSLRKYDLSTLSTGTTMGYCFAVSAENIHLYSILERLTSGMNRTEVHSLLARFSSVDRKVTLADFVSDNFGLVLLFAGVIFLVICVQWMRSVVVERRTQRLNVELERAREQAEAANRAKSTFLFNMSHDIRTPMNAIVGYTELIQRNGADPEKCADYLKKIQYSSRFLLSLINNVLEMARIESNQQELVETPTRANQIVSEVVAVYSGLMKEKNIGFFYSEDIKTQYIYVDAVKIKAILLNLLSNAYKYTPAGGAITFSVRELPCEKPGYVLLETGVSDTGVGMSEEFLPRLFDEFSRERSSAVSKIQGTGLGMPIVKRLVELMDGTITVDSAPGKGTTVLLRIPHRIASGDSVPKEEPVTSQPQPFTGKRVLIAEDNELNAEIATEILKGMGFVTERAADGAICVQMLQKAEPGYYDLILMDIQMPNMDGYTATRTIRTLADSQRGSIPIVAMTANAFEEDKREAMAAGMDGHIAKPIDVKKLIQTLASVLK